MNHKMMKAVPLTALVLGLVSTSQAQPALQQGNAQNPQNLQIGGPGGGPGGRGGGFGGMQMTPEQRQQRMEQMREQTLRFQLIDANIDQKAQDAIVLHDKAQNAASSKIQDLMWQLVEAVSTKETPDTKIAALLKQIEDATATEKTRRKKADSELDAKIGYSKNARLSAMLTTMGIIGDEALLTGNTQNGMMGGMGGRGGRGGFGGPGGGGFGGPGGPPPGQ